jgi:hypothetical protein
MLGLNVVAIVAGTAALAAFLSRRGRSPWFALLYALWPGMVFCVSRDLSEPLAYGLLAAAILLFDRGRVWPACAVLALAALTRETVVAFAHVGALVLWRRPWRAAAFLAGVLVPMLAWRLIVTAWLGSTTVADTGGWKALFPFYGLRAWWPWHDQQWLLLLAVDVPLLAACLLAARARVAAVPLTLLLINVALFVVFIPRAVLVDFPAAGRSAAPAVVAFVCCLPFWRTRSAFVAAALVSPLWYVLVAELLGVASLRLVST